MNKAGQDRPDESHANANANDDADEHDDVVDDDDDDDNGPANEQRG